MIKQRSSVTRQTLSDFLLINTRKDISFILLTGVGELFPQRKKNCSWGMVGNILRCVQVPAKSSNLTKRMKIRANRFLAILSPSFPLSSLQQRCADNSCRGYRIGGCVKEWGWHRDFVQICVWLVHFKDV